MSFDFRTINQPSTDPQLKYLHRLRTEMAKFLTKDLIDQLEGSEDIFGDIQDVDSAIKFQTDLSYTHHFNFDKDYYAPDDRAKGMNLWVRGMSNWRLRDFAENINGLEGRVYGDPLLVNGSPFDHGCWDESAVKSIALRFNRPTSLNENSEGIRVDHDSSIQLSDETTAMAYFLRYRPHSFTQVDGSNRRLFEKTDGTGWSTFPSNGVMLCTTTSGALDITFRRGGTLFEKRSATNLSTNTVYDIWVIWDQTLADGHADKIKVYVNNVRLTMNNTALSYGWRFAAGGTDQTLSIMDSGGSTAHGHTYADFYDMKIYKGHLVTETEVGYHWTNKLSISDIDFGHVIMTNHWTSSNPIVQPPFFPSHTSASHTSASHTV